MKIAHKPRPAKTHTNEATHRSEGAVTSLLLFVGGGIIDSLLITNNSAVAGFIHIWDSATVPADTTVPHYPPIPLAASSYVRLTDLGFPVTVGACISISSTLATTTLSANAAFIAAVVRT